MKKIFSKTNFPFLTAVSALFFLLFFIVLSSFLIIRKSVIGRSGEKRYNIILNTRIGHYDKGFSQQAVEGVCAAFVISPSDCNGGNSLFKDGLISFGYPHAISDGRLIDGYVDNFIENEGINVFVLPGFTYLSYIQEYVPLYTEKDIIFLSIDTNANFCNPNAGQCPKAKAWPKNFWEIRFKQYLAGYYAALYAGAYALQNPEHFHDYDSTKAGKQIAFGALGGLFIAPIKRYLLGYRLGLEIINQNKVHFVKSGTQSELVFADYQTIGGFDTVKLGQKTRALSLEMFKKKISVIFSIAVSLTNVMHNAALEMDTSTKQKKHWVIGVDVDQGVSLYNQSTETIETDSYQKNKILVSAILRIKEAVADVIKNKIEKKIVPQFAVIKTDSQFISIPERFRKTALWKKVIKLLLDKLEIAPNILEKFDKWSNNYATDQELEKNFANPDFPIWGGEWN